jgi:hypothetical protein
MNRNAANTLPNKTRFLNGAECFFVTKTLYAESNSPVPVRYLAVRYLFMFVHAENSLS